MWWKVLCHTSRWTLAGRVRSGNSVRRLSTGVLLVMVFTLGISASAAEASADSVVTPSRMWLFQQSTRRPKCDRKSTSDDVLRHFWCKTLEVPQELGWLTVANFLKREELPDALLR